MTATDALQDPRWTTFTTTGYACSCGEHHVGLFPIHLNVPVGWPGGTAYQPESGSVESDYDLRTDGDFLSHNFCVWGGKNFAIRMRVYLKVTGAEPAAFLFNAWAGLDRMDFDAFSEAMLKPGTHTGLRTRARLLNRLSRFPDTYNLSGTAVHVRPGESPVLMIHGIQADFRADHSLIVQQREGISVDRVFELFSAYRHNMVPAP